MEQTNVGRQVCPTGKDAWARIERDAAPFGVTVIRTAPMRLVCTRCAKVWKPLSYEGRGIDFECHGCTKSLASVQDIAQTDINRLVSAVTQAVEAGLGERLRAIETELADLKATIAAASVGGAPDPDEVMNVAAAAKYLGIAKSTLSKWISRGCGPRSIALTGDTRKRGRVGFRRRELAAWCKTRLRG